MYTEIGTSQITIEALTDEYYSSQMKQKIPEAMKDAVFWIQGPYKRGGGSKRREQLPLKVKQQYLVTASYPVVGGGGGEPIVYHSKIFIFHSSKVKKGKFNPPLPFPAPVLLPSSLPSRAFISLISFFLSLYLEDYTPQLTMLDPPHGKSGDITRIIGHNFRVGETFRIVFGVYYLYPAFMTDQIVRIFVPFGQPGTEANVWVTNHCSVHLPNAVSSNVLTFRYDQDVNG